MVITTVMIPHIHLVVCMNILLQDTGRNTTFPRLLMVEESLRDRFLVLWEALVLTTKDILTQGIHLMTDIITIHTTTRRKHYHKIKQ